MTILFIFFTTAMKILTFIHKLQFYKNETVSVKFLTKPIYDRISFIKIKDQIVVLLNFKVVK